MPSSRSVECGGRPVQNPPKIYSAGRAATQTTRRARFRACGICQIFTWPVTTNVCCMTVFCIDVKGLLQHVVHENNSIIVANCGFVPKKGALFHPPASSSQSVGQLLTQLRNNNNARNMNITSPPPNPPSPLTPPPASVSPSSIFQCVRLRVCSCPPTGP